VAGREEQEEEGGGERGPRIGRRVIVGSAEVGPKIHGLVSGRRFSLASAIAAAACVCVSIFSRHSFLLTFKLYIFYIFSLYL
jgi:hypothetical protein